MFYMKLVTQAKLLAYQSFYTYHTDSFKKLDDEIHNLNILKI